MSEETYGEMIARLRTAKDWTQAELAERSGVGERTVQAIEAGETSSPQRRVRLALATALEIEGNAEDERQSWSADVKVFLNVMGAYLEELSERDREIVMTRITRDLFARLNGRA